MKTKYKIELLQEEILKKMSQEHKEICDRIVELGNKIIDEYREGGILFFTSTLVFIVTNLIRFSKQDNCTNEYLALRHLLEEMIASITKCLAVHRYEEMTNTKENTKS